MGIRRARTATFISLVWAEGVRAYCSRSFENPIWVNMFSNMSMNKAVALAQVTLFIALYLPGLNHVLGLYVDEIHGWGWFIAFQGAVACGVGCELYKSSPSSSSWRQSSPDTRRMRMAMSRALSRRTRLPSPSTSKDSVGESVRLKRGRRSRRES